MPTGSPRPSRAHSPVVAAWHSAREGTVRCLGQLGRLPRRLLEKGSEADQSASTGRNLSPTLAGALWRWSRDAIWGLSVTSAVINVLALTGSFYMLQVYDRVLASRSVSTLVGLTLLMLMMYGLYGVLDAIRSFVIVRISSRAERQLREATLSAILTAPLRQPLPGDGLQPIRDLDQIRNALNGGGPNALFDLPWIPVYLGLVFVLHPLLGALATIGALVLVAATIVTERKAREPAMAVAKSAAERQQLLDVIRKNVEVIHAHGLHNEFLKRWRLSSEKHMNDVVKSVESPSPIVTFSRVFRMVLQSLILGVGAYVVLRGEASGGVMIASSIIAGRALAPLEVVISSWRGAVAAQQAYKRLSEVLAKMPPAQATNILPPPTSTLSVTGLTLTPPGTTRVVVSGVSFDLKAGDGLGIIGPSASGKSSLARALVGVWAPARGEIRLDGAVADHWGRDRIGPHMGYLPQDVEIFDGTIAENIARLDAEADPAKIVAAAKAAGIHEMVLAMPNDYNMLVGRAGASLSAGQRQRLALARALYGDPFLVVLDEPNSNLDAEGEVALAQALEGIRKRGGIVVVVAHRPSAIISLNKLMVMANGQMSLFGPKEEVLSRISQRPSSPTLSIVPQSGSSS